MSEAIFEGITQSNFEVCCGGGLILVKYVSTLVNPKQWNHIYTGTQKAGETWETVRTKEGGSMPFGGSRTGNTGEGGHT